MAKHNLLDVDFAETMAKTCITVLKQVSKRIQNYRIMASFLRPSEENEHILVQLKVELDPLEAWTMERNSSVVWFAVKKVVQEIQKKSNYYLETFALFLKINFGAWEPHNTNSDSPFCHAHAHLMFSLDAADNVGLHNGTKHVVPDMHRGRNIEELTSNYLAQAMWYVGVYHRKVEMEKMTAKIDYIDTGLKELDAKLDSKFESVPEDFKKLDSKFKSVQEDLKNLEKG